LTTIRHPRKSRSVSIGPQSEADAYEALAYRERRRRESISETAESRLSWQENGRIPEEPEQKLHTQTTKLNHEHIMKADSPTVLRSDGNVDLPLSNDTSRYEKEEREMFAKLEKPRVRYDVEVITKLIVYSGET
jgi:dihydrosphingosine 1-phosphate phosphatase